MSKGAGSPLALAMGDRLHEQCRPGALVGWTDGNNRPWTALSPHIHVRSFATCDVTLSHPALTVAHLSVDTVQTSRPWVAVRRV
ncbi:MAG: hypothetical protein DHS20C11_21600 [Lysobacteraceae bacterium]|nr:MAG: hypothetical protein DHS20C11_21600 [Xanthomonadaceae bacterium]